MFEKLLSGARPLSRVWHDTSGGALIYTAILIPSLIGFVGLGVDVALWHLSKRETQTMADAGAIAAAQDFIKYGDMDTIDVAGEEGAVANQYSTAEGNIAVNNPPVEGDFAGDDEYIEVALDMPADNLFSSLFIRGNRIASRAVTHVRHVPGDTCLMALDPAMDAALGVGGTADVGLNCGAVVNSTSDIGANIFGSSCFESTSLRVSGGADITANQAGCNYPTETIAPPRRDPLRDLPMPETADSGCDVTNVPPVNNGQTTTLPVDPPNTFDMTEADPWSTCNIVRVNNGGTLIFNSAADPDIPPFGYYEFQDGLKVEGGSVVFGPGLYIFSGGSFDVTGTVSLVGDGVTFYFGPDSEGFKIAGTTSGSLTAPGLDPDAPDFDPDYPYNGLLVIEDPEAGPHNNRINGTSGFLLEGIVYSPNSALDFSGTSGTEGAAFIANNFDVTGTSDLGVINSIIIQDLLAEQFVDLVE